MVITVKNLKIYYYDHVNEKSNAYRKTYCNESITSHFAKFRQTAGRKTYCNIHYTTCDVMGFPVTCDVMDSLLYVFLPAIWRNFSKNEKNAHIIQNFTFNTIMLLQWGWLEHNKNFTLVVIWNIFQNSWCNVISALVQAPVSYTHLTLPTKA